MVNPKLARRHRVMIDTRIALARNQTGTTDPESLRWESSDENIATVTTSGMVERNMLVDFGSVTITASGYFMDYTVPDEQYFREFRGSVTFDLLPLNEVLPILTIPIVTKTS